MRPHQEKALFFNYISSIFMMLALAWLTVSAPFVNVAQQEKMKIAQSASAEDDKNTDTDTAANPFANTTEEKTSSGSTGFSEEYLHHIQMDECSFSVPSIYYKVENIKAYIAFHGELLSPPPEA